MKCVGTLFLNAQPFGFLVGRHCRKSGETFHYFIEALVKGLHGLDNFGNFWELKSLVMVVDRALSWVGNLS